jgi:hypothetical protein
MSDNAMEQIVSTLRHCGASWYPERGEMRNVRIVGHTPKTDHYIYDAVMEFAEGGERLAIKVFRANRCGAQGVRSLAAQELRHLQSVYALVETKKLAGIPRPLGDFAELGAIVSQKLGGIPLQSIIMKAALLPGYADCGTLQYGAKRTGEWLRKFHRATADMPEPFDAAGFLADLEKLCAGCKKEGLDDLSIKNILGGAKTILARARKTLPSSAVLNNFTPLNVVITEDGVGFCDFAKTSKRGSSFQDLALFLASVEALEKYPFCDRSITSEVQSSFLESYGVSAADQRLLRVLKMKTLLSMLVQGRTIRESAARKKVMWANVMKRFIQRAAERALAPTG